MSSFIDNIVSSVRKYVDEPTLIAKYSESEILAMVERNYPTIISEVNRNKRNGIVSCTYDVILTESKNSYILPPHIGQILYVYDNQYDITDIEVSPALNLLSYSNKFVYINGNMLNIKPSAKSNYSKLSVRYIPEYICSLHKGNVTTVGDDADTVVIGTETTGSIDNAYGAYSGYMFRLLSADTNGYIQERIIIDYDPSESLFSLALPLSPVPEGNIVYEVCPPIKRNYDDIVCLYVGMSVSAIEGDTKRYSMLKSLYADRIRNLRLSVAHSESNTAYEVQNRSKSRRFGRL